jgi:hypothetical protein
MENTGLLLTLIIALIVFITIAIYKPDVFESLSHQKAADESYHWLSWYNFYNEKNLFTVYACLGIQMMRQDRGDLRSQQTLFINLLHRRFGKWGKKEITKKYLDYLRAIHKPVYSSFFKWMNSKSNDEEKIQLLDILADLAYHNDVVTTGEFKTLYKYAASLKISQETIRSLIASRQSRLAQEQHRKSANISRPRYDHSLKIKQKLHILGLTKAIHLDDIKKAHRKMAMTFHPDRYAKASKGEQDMAHERFIEIQKAYEFLTENF